jgi:hypothetical protein
MTDRELLELAAKAVRIERQWNPIFDDGDALRLAAKLAMCVDFMDGRVIAGELSEVVIDFEDEDYRRAIVRAAAEIGRVML